MASSIFPDVESAGAVVIRDESGNCLNPPEVHNAYCPPATFAINCPPTALPSDCDARIEPRQINAIVSEFIGFVECLDPNGPWDCNSLKNMCTAFSSWSAQYVVPIHVGDTAPAVPAKNQLWWETDSSMLLIWYKDPDGTEQWVQTGSSGKAFVDGASIDGDGSATDPYHIGVIDCGTWS